MPVTASFLFFQMNYSQLILIVLIDIIILMPELYGVFFECTQKFDININQVLKNVN